MPILLVLVGLVTYPANGANGEESIQPNIVYVLADDLGWGDVGAYNPESKIPTPHMDRLAEEGIRFTDAHSPSAVCTPTRYGLLTGRYAWRTRLTSGVLWGWSRSLIEPDRLTVASLLKDHGYHTACIGKWHLGFQEFDTDAGDDRQQPDVDYEKPLRPGPVTVGFDYFFGIPASLDMEPYIYVLDDAPVEQATEHVEASAHRRQGGGGFWRAGPIAPNFRHIDVHPKITEKAVAYIDQRGEEPETPFFLYVPLASPHTPWLPTEPFRGLSQMDAHGGYYGDFVAEVDATVGEIVKALERIGQVDNTLLIVTSDNGAHWPEADKRKYDHHANGPFRGQKADIHEGGHRVPFIARWPERIAAGAISDQLMCLVDLTATVAAILEVTLPEDAAEDSFDMLPALLGAQHAPLRPYAIHHSVNGTFAIRHGEWKLIEHLGSGGFTAPRRVDPEPDGPQGQLYNLADDIAEEDNRWLDEPEVVEQLTELLDQVRRSGRSRPAVEE